MSSISLAGWWLLAWHLLAWHLLTWHLPASLHRLSVALHLLTGRGLLTRHRLPVASISLDRGLSVSLTRWHGRWHAPISLHLLGLLGRRHRHAIATVSWHLTRGSSWLGLRLLCSCCATSSAKLTKKVVLLQIAGELKIVNALLQANQDIIELHVELCALLQLH